MSCRSPTSPCVCRTLPPKRRRLHEGRRETRSCDNGRHWKPAANRTKQASVHASLSYRSLPEGQGDPDTKRGPSPSLANRESVREKKREMEGGGTRLCLVSAGRSFLCLARGFVNYFSPPVYPNASPWEYGGMGERMRTAFPFLLARSRK